MEEIAALFASLQLKIDAASWAKGDKAIAGVASKMAGLEGAFQDKGGKWRAANGRFLTMKERIGAGLGGALDSTRRKADATGDAMGRMWQFAVMGAAVVGIDKAAHALIGFNQEVQDSKISLSAMISGMTGTEWKTAERQADALYNEFQRFSTTTPVTTQQILEFGKGIAAATFAAGGGVKELQNLTEQGVIASKVLGGNRGAGYAELEITEMLSGTINKRMILARQLLSFGHMTEESFKALSGKGRIAALQKIFNSEAMNNARDKFGKSFSGVTSTLWDNLQIAFGKVGLPLFEAITARVQDLNKWMMVNKSTIEAYAKAVGSRLVSAFNLFVGALRFVANHAAIFEGVLVGMGALIAGFAVQAAIEWAIAFWPLTLAVATIAALHAGIKWLEGDADETKDKFDSWIPGLQKVNTELDKIRHGQVRPDMRGGAPGAASDAQDDKPVLRDYNGNVIDDEWTERVGRMPERTPARLTQSAQQQTPVVVVKPEVTVQMTGNIPNDWIDQRVDTRVQEHHETTWRNADAALSGDAAP